MRIAVHTHHWDNLYRRVLLQGDPHCGWSGFYLGFLVWGGGEILKVMVGGGGGGGGAVIGHAF